MTDADIKKAIWTPSWYELDQSLFIGRTNKFWFCQSVPSNIECDSEIDLVFSNEPDSGNPTEVRSANVVEIYHENLGQLAGVDANGLDYIFKLSAGKEILVNAEEEPGKPYDDELSINDWSLIVTLSGVSEPLNEKT